LRFPEPGKSAEKIIASMEKFTAKGVEMLAFPVLDLAAKCRERLLAFGEETV